MEGLKGSRLPKPTGIKSHNKLNPLAANKLHHNVVATTSRHLLPRRSNSVADLRTIVDESHTVSKINAQNTRTASAPKRKIEKSSDESKPKVFKQVKIPDWDYKARFNQLRERHTLLNEDHKKQSCKLIELEDIERNYQEIRKKHEVLAEDYSTLSKLNSSLTNDKKQFGIKIANLEASLDALARNHKELSTNYEMLLVEAKCNRENVEKLTNENSIFKNTLQHLREDYDQLKVIYEKAIADRNALNDDYKKVVRNNEKLNQNLDMEIQKNKDLLEQVNHLKKDVQDGQILRRKLHNTVQDLKGNIRVFCRVRPPINLEEEERLQCMINILDEKSIEIRKSRESVSTVGGKLSDVKAEFTLDRIFDTKSSQNEIFEDLSQLVHSALDGYDICVFAYGQTGSGKTYTMYGGENDYDAGMIPRTIDLIFNSIDDLRRTGWVYQVNASFLEIYNESVRDLLNTNCAQNLEIRYNEGKGTTVTNLTIQSINSSRDLKKWMTVAHRNRAVAVTDFNEHSSRSHAVTKIYLQGVNDEINTKYTGSVNLVDLAGSESAKTSANERLIEIKNINKSLSTLGSVILALYNKEKHIPYRNSKLTYLLQSCLGGTSKTLMVVNIAPFEDCFSESISSLRFASKVKEVKMTAKRNKTQIAASVSKV